MIGMVTDELSLHLYILFRIFYNIYFKPSPNMYIEVNWYKHCLDFWISGFRICNYSFNYVLILINLVGHEEEW